MRFFDQEDPELKPYDCLLDDLKEIWNIGGNLFSTFWSRIWLMCEKVSGKSLKMNRSLQS